MKETPRGLLKERLLKLAPSAEAYLQLRANCAKTFSTFNTAAYIAGVGDRHTGNFLLSRRTSGGKEHVGRYLTCRELFHDWANEDVLDLEILRSDCEKTPRPPIDEAGAVELMHTIGQLTNHHMRFWNAFYTQLLETYGKTEIGLSAEGERQFMPVNDMNAPNALGIATGTAFLVLPRKPLEASHQRHRSGVAGSVAPTGAREKESEDAESQLLSTQ